MKILDFTKAKEKLDLNNKITAINEIADAETQIMTLMLNIKMSGLLIDKKAFDLTHGELIEIFEKSKVSYFSTVPSKPII